MKCNHCGLCCRDPRTQINLTVGDIYRITDFLKISVEEIFKEHVGIMPFGDYDLIHYDLDIGLDLPCKFRINERCSIYQVRPLNCRLFPYWVLSEAPPEKLKYLLDKHKCSYDLAKKETYTKYKEIVGNTLLEESKFFEMNKKIDITKIKGFDRIKEEDFSEREDKKIKLMKENIKVEVPLKSIKESINKNLNEIKENQLKLKEAEEIIKE